MNRKKSGLRIGIIGDGQLGNRLFKMFNYANPSDNFLVSCYSRKCGFDMTDLSWVKQIMQMNDVVINCVAMTDVDSCETAPNEAIHLNSILPAALGAIESNALIVHISTDYVYGDAQDEFGTHNENEENRPAFPVNFYGKTKLTGDFALLANNSIADRLLILRPSWLFDQESDKSIVARIYDKLKNEQVVKAVDDIYGVPTECSLLYDVIMAFISGDVRPGLYNVRNGTRDGECPSIYDIACFIANEVHGNTLCVEKMKSSDFHTYAPRQTNSMLSIKKLENEFAGTLTGRLPFKHWKDAIKDFIVNRNVVEMAKEAAKVDLGKLAEKFK